MKGRTVLLIIMVVVLVYVLGLVIATRPESTGRDAASLSLENLSSTQPVVIAGMSEEEISQLVDRRVSEQLAAQKDAILAQARVDASAVVNQAIASIPQTDTAAEHDKLRSGILSETEKLIAQSAEQTTEQSETSIATAKNEVIIQTNRSIENAKTEVNRQTEKVVQQANSQTLTAVRSEIEAAVAQAKAEILEQIAPYELTAEDLEPFIPGIVEAVYPQVLARVIDTFSDSGELQKAIVEWMRENGDEVVANLIVAVVSSEQLDTKVNGNIAAATPAIEQQIETDLSEKLEPAVEYYVDAYLDELDLQAQFAAAQPAAEVVQQPEPEPAAEPQPVAEVVQQPEPAAEPAAKDEAEFPAEEGLEPGNGIIEMTDEEYAAAMAEAKRSATADYTQKINK
ncbi:MAG: hypothetical protein J5785_07220 [Spirochaetales bacterium]|nr:hypothetical protein [Spirochaetales bacterium]